MSDADFVIVGGGIGGAVLGEQLARQGKKTIVLERNLGPPKWTRPEGLWPATREILFTLHPREVWEAEAMAPLKGVEVDAGGETIRLITQEAIDRSGVQLWFTDPNETRELLLRRGSFDLRRGMEVIEVLKEGTRIAGVTARELKSGREHVVLARWTVGDDGGNSLVRRACGIEIRTRLFPVEFFCFGLQWPGALRPGVAQLWSNPKETGSGILAMAVMPVPRQRGVGLIAIRAKAFDANRNVREAWGRFVGGRAVIDEILAGRKFPDDLVRVRRPWGHADAYGTDGAVLMGDAVHPVSPAGGQGANMSVADAAVLAELAAGDEKNLVAEYERRRRPANQRSIRPTQIAHFMFGTWPLPGEFFVGMLRWMSGHPRAMARLLRGAGSAFVEKR
jgi:2-polyprenyl-6-methoxyphenol hydroxylase-like FAD-dependent oxidoreductase